MKGIFKYTCTALILLLAFAACKKNDYLKGGTIRSNQVDMTTYDWLKSNPQGLFDTLLLLVDKAGLKDKINETGITFFAPTDYAINNYLTNRALEEQDIDAFRKWTIDSLFKYEMPKFTDSLDAYIVPGILTYDKLTINGVIYPTKKIGANSVVSYEETRDPAYGYNPNVSTIPQLVWYTLLLEPLAPPFVAADLTVQQGTRVRVQTSGIQSTTGVIHVLNNSHKLFFRK
jgi:hypothetical protein